LKYALHLEDEGRFKEAEEYFIKSGKVIEAVHMWMHKQDHHSALAIARQYLPNDEINKIYIDQAKYYLERNDYGKAEQCYINAKKPEEAINMYRKARMQGEAMRVAMKHAPHLRDEVNRE
jgi:intraflagellar transport protein 172